ncbi:MAG: hypothetical protein M3301_04660, partial [Chloroflexota bacterium]|nr:hypothetical protein [Chloroflexota bacterium]
PEETSPAAREAPVVPGELPDARGEVPTADGQLRPAPAAPQPSGETLWAGAGDGAEAAPGHAAQQARAPAEPGEAYAPEREGTGAGETDAPEYEEVGIEPERRSIEPATAEPAAGPRRELRAIESALAEGRVGSVAGRLALVLRTDPALAASVLDVAARAIEIGGLSGIEAGNLHIVRGDAYRVLGRGRDAETAYEQSRRTLEGSWGSEGEE